MSDTASTKAWEEPDELPGLGRFDKCELLEVLGVGGMGTVMRARDVQLDREVALKFMNAKSLEGRGPARFRNEARLLARLDHPNIARIHGFVESDGHAAIDMQLIRGQSMDRIEPDPARALSIAYVVIDAVRYAHEQRVLHYMAPERLRGEQVGTWTDVYGLGAFLYYLITGSAPFRADAMSRLVEMTLKEPPRPPCAASRVPLSDEGRRRLDEVVMRCLRVELEGRLPSLEPASPTTVTPAEDSPRRQAGDRVGRYELTSHLAAGGLDVTWSARDTKTQQQVRLRILDPRASVGDAFEAEQRLLRELRHPGLLPLIDSGADGADLFLVEPLPEAAVLGSLELPPPRLIDAAIDLCRTLSYLHGEGVVRAHEIPRVRELNHDVPRDLEAVIMKALDPNPEHRFATAAGLQADLEAFRRQMPVHAYGGGILYRMSKSARRLRGRG